MKLGQVTKIDQKKQKNMATSKKIEMTSYGKLRLHRHFSYLLPTWSNPKDGRWNSINNNPSFYKNSKQN